MYAPGVPQRRPTERSDGSGCASGHAAARPAAKLDETADARDQLIFVERLSDIEISALLQAPSLVERCVLAADQDDGDITALLHLLEPATELEAILLGQND